MSDTIKVIKEAHLYKGEDDKFHVDITYLDGDSEGDNFTEFDEAVQFLQSKEGSMMNPDTIHEEIQTTQKQVVREKTDEILDPEDVYPPSEQPVQAPPEEDEEETEPADNKEDYDRR